LFETSERAL